MIFTNNRSGTNDIFALTLKSMQIKQLTNSDANDERGELSPNGEYLVFSSDRYKPGNQDILMKNLKTGAVENITNSEGTELIARWSTDGDFIFFGSNKDGNWELYTYNFEDKSTVRITQNEAFDGDPRVLKKSSKK